MPSTGRATVVVTTRQVTVIGPVSMDTVTSVEALPAPGQSVVATSVERVVGGRGAALALAARGIGAAVRLVSAVGRDEAGLSCRDHLRAAGIDADLYQAAAIPTETRVI